MPRLSDTMDSGTIGKWLKKVGDQISQGEIIAEIETDKANMDMEAFADGVLARIIVDEGQSVNLGEPIAILAADAAEAEKIQSEGPTTAAASAPASVPAQPAQAQAEQAAPSQGAPAASQ